MNDVLRIPPLGRDREALLSAKLGVGLQKTGLSIEDKGVAESRDLHLVPSLAKDNVALKNFVFECRAEASLRSPLFYGLLDLTSDPAHRAHLCPLELSDLELAVEHALDKGSVFMDLERFADQLQLLHDLELRVEFHYNPSDAHSKVGHVFPCVVLKLRDTNESRTDGESRTIKGGVAKAELRGVFNHAEALGFHVVCAEDWHCLEFAPAHGKCERVFVL